MKRYASRAAEHGARAVAGHDIDVWAICASLGPSEVASAPAKVSNPAVTARTSFSNLMTISLCNARAPEIGR
jgi:hypothetical protein